jgi:hypothetical protein
MGYQLTDQIDWTSKGPGITSVWPLHRLTANHLAIYRAIARWENDTERLRVLAGEIKEFSSDGFKAWCRAGQARLAFDAGVSLHTAFRCLKDLSMAMLIDELPGPKKDDPKYRRITQAGLDELLSLVEPTLTHWKEEQANARKEKVAKGGAFVRAEREQRRVDDERESLRGKSLVEIRLGGESADPSLFDEEEYRAQFAKELEAMPGRAEAEYEEDQDEEQYLEDDDVQYEEDEGEEEDVDLSES